MTRYWLIECRQWPTGVVKSSFLHLVGKETRSLWEARAFVDRRMRRTGWMSSLCRSLVNKSKTALVSILFNLECTCPLYRCCYVLAFQSVLLLLMQHVSFIVCLLCIYGSLRHITLPRGAAALSSRRSEAWTLVDSFVAIMFCDHGAPLLTD